jgi:Ca-activated chloride channel family protein
MRFKCFLLVTCVLAAYSAVAASVGTITGRVIDAKSRQPIAFANVQVVGMPRGAMTGDDGRFTIQDLPESTYTVKVMMMGYQTIEQRDVVVRAGKETELAFAMNVTVVAEMQEILVTGERKTVDVSSSDVRSSVNDEQVREMPVESAVDAIALKTGVVKSGEELHARGGRSGGTTDIAAHLRAQSGPFTTEAYDHITENEFLEAMDNPVSTFSIDVDAASYSNMRRFINEGRLPPTDAVRIEELINYFSYDYPEPEGPHPFSIITEVSACPWKLGHKLVHIGLQGKRVSVKDLPPNNLVFLIDVSGSMQPPNKLPLLKAAFRLLTDNLRAEDRIAIVVYAGAAGLVLPSTRGSEKQTILDAIDNLQAGGTTAGAAGIQLAYRVAKDNVLKKGNNRVILATDGDFNVGVTSDGELVRIIEENRKSGIFLTVLGFGEGNLKDSRMEKIADHGNGHYAYIDTIKEARKVLISEMGATLLTIAKDVKIQIEFNPTKVRSYRLIGYENRLLKKEDFDDDTKDAGELGAGHSVTALYEIIPAKAGEEISQRADSRYVQVSLTPQAHENLEMLTVKFRYKAPDADDSRLIVETMSDSDQRFDDASEDLMFSAAVVEFGLLLRDSKFKGTSHYSHVVDAATRGKGKDNEGYRAEFIQLVEACRLLAKE